MVDERFDFELKLESTINCEVCELICTSDIKYSSKKKQVFICTYHFYFSRGSTDDVSTIISRE